VKPYKQQYEAAQERLKQYYNNMPEEGYTEAADINLEFNLRAEVKEAYRQYIVTLVNEQEK
jgi:hypothetical protein